MNKFKISWAPPSIGDEEHQRAIDVIKSNWMTQGKITHLLENKISKILNVKHTVVVNNGTSALQCALLSHGIGPGDEVIVPTFTFVATVNSILSVGAKPILVDCDLNTFNTNVDLIKSHITPKTRAILPVDVGGMPIDVKQFQEFVKKKNLILIEDAAEAFGGEYCHKKIGSFGHSTIFSFHMAKVIAGVEGGCLVTNDDSIAQNARLVRSHGSAKPYDSKLFGLNMRISDIHSAIILKQLERLEIFLSHRNKLATIYKNSLSEFSFQEIPSYVTLHPYMLFGVITKPSLRNKLNLFLKKHNIETRICWPPIHTQKYHSKLFVKQKFPNSEKIYSRLINLPMGNGLSEENVNHVIQIIKKFKN